MGTAILPAMWPPVDEPASLRRRHHFGFSLLLLLLALSLIASTRTYAPASIRALFAPLPINSPQDLLLLLLALLMAMVLHEAGHLLAALLLGFHVLGGSLGPLQIRTIPGDRKVFWSAASFFTASVSAIPTTMTSWRTATLAVVTAGPLATLLSGLALASLHPVLHSLVVFRLAFVQISLLLFFIGLIPNGRSASQPNDARLFLNLTSHNNGADDMELHVMLLQKMLAGERPQDYPLPFLSRLSEFRGRPEMQLLFAQALAQWATDSDQIGLADAWDTHALRLADSCSPRFRNSALASSACFDVLFRRDLESARAKFDRVNFATLFPTCFEQRARASHQIAIGRPHRAPAFIIRAQYALPRGNSHYALERALLAKLHMQVLAGEAIPRPRFNTASA